MNEQKFFRCKHCGNLMSAITDSGVPMICCGEQMEALTANTVDASAEKHLPSVSQNGRLVHAKVGSVAHPMTEEHHIEFIYLLTEHGGQIKKLRVEDNPEAMFAVLEDTALQVFAYCNLHGLWKAVLPCGCGCSDHAAHSEESPPEETICSAEFAEGCKSAEL